MKFDAKFAYDLYYFSTTGDSWFGEEELKPYMVDKCRYTLYRGLFLPTEEIRAGNVIEQWGACSHWTSNIHVANSFIKVCNTEEYVAEYGLGRGTDGSFEEGFKLFSKVIMCMQGSVNALPLGRTLLRHSNDPEFIRIMREHEVWDDFKDSLMDIIKEDEYSFFGYDFLITNVEKFGDVWCLDVVQTPKTVKQ